jgi:hypothetical protein
MRRVATEEGAQTQGSNIKELLNGPSDGLVQ